GGLENSDGEGIVEEGGEGDAAVVRGDHVCHLVEPGLDGILQAYAERSVEDADAAADYGARVGAVGEADAGHILGLRSAVQGARLRADSSERESAGREELGNGDLGSGAQRIRSLR